jgi:hypothetical protein
MIVRVPAEIPESPAAVRMVVKNLCYVTEKSYRHQHHDGGEGRVDGKHVFPIPRRPQASPRLQYVALNQNQQIGDVTNHVQGFVRYPGIASFPDGSTARTTVFNACDGVAGSWGRGNSQRL